MNRYVPAVLLSVALNGAALVGFDRAVFYQAHQTLKKERKLELQRKRDELSFEFVEAPPKTRPDRPEKTRKQSDRDAVAQDLGSERTPDSLTPATQNTGLADQLRQQRGSTPQPASPESTLATTEEVKEKHENKPTEEAKKPEPQTSMNAFEKAPLAQAVRSDSAEDVKLVEEETRTQEKKPRQSFQSQPKAAVQSLTGNDRINTPEMSRQPAVSAKFFGITSFETTGSGMGEYMKVVKEKVWLAWYPFLSFRYPQDYRSADVVVSMRIDPSGEIKSVRVVDLAGDPLFADYCLSALQKVSSFGKLPDEIVALLEDGTLEIRFGFHYR